MEGPVLITGLAIISAAIIYDALILFFYSGWRRLRRIKHAESGVAGLRVTVIIAARNEENHILAILEDLTRQDYPDALKEVIIADDHSKDRTAAFVGEFIKMRGLQHFRLVRMEGPDGGGSKKAAILRAIEASSGTIILLTDADCRLSNGWMTAMTKPFLNSRIMMVAGPVAFHDQRSFLAQFQALEFLGLVGSGVGAAGAGHPFLCNGSCLGYRKQAFLQVNGFEGNEKYRSGDDIFLMHKIKKAFGASSIAFVMEEDALVRTSPASGFRHFIRQRVRWASKSTGYRDFISIFTAKSVLFMALIMAGCFIAGFFIPVYFLVFFGLVIFKTLADLPLLIGITTFARQQSLMKWTVLFQALYPFYVVTAGIASLFRREKW